MFYLHDFRTTSLMKLATFDGLRWHGDEQHTHSTYAETLHKLREIIWISSVDFLFLHNILSLPCSFRSSYRLILEDEPRSWEFGKIALMIFPFPSFGIYYSSLGAIFFHSGGELFQFEARFNRGLWQQLEKCRFFILLALKKTMINFDSDTMKTKHFRCTFRLERLWRGKRWMSRMRKKHAFGA